MTQQISPDHLRILQAVKAGKTLADNPQTIADAFETAGAPHIAVRMSAENTPLWLTYHITPNLTKGPEHFFSKANQINFGLVSGDKVLTQNPTTMKKHQAAKKMATLILEKHGL
ncbi:MAG: hypothetical protein K9G62_08915 [Alphaproteobacteria bacterium]|nr:hypothetical protein [Alphaproteobacteria bacterium]